jgi:hypothetical protein
MRRVVPAPALIAALAVVLSACTGVPDPTTSLGSGSTDAPSSSAATASPTPGGVRNVDFLRITDGIPIAREAAEIGMAFDAAEAVQLVSEPPSIDYTTQAILCLWIGERPTGGWSVIIGSITVEDGEMQILAREGRPRPGEGTTQAFTYPGDCAVVDRTVLPVGQLAVRADDTISDEFIVDATIEVPAR